MYLSVSLVRVLMREIRNKREISVPSCMYTRTTVRVANIMARCSFTIPVLMMRSARSESRIDANIKNEISQCEESESASMLTEWVVIFWFTVPTKTERYFPVTFGIYGRMGVGMSNDDIDALV